MSKSHKRTLLRILLGALLFAAALLIPQKGVARLFLFLPAYLTVGGDVLWKACRHIARGQVFDENFLMCIATIGAFFVGEYPEGVAVMLFYQVGELFQSYAVSRSRQSISTLMDIRPDYANIPTPDGLKQVDPEEVAVGDKIVIKAGEKVPLDGRVLEGISTLDTSALTGEALPREVESGDSIISGCINLTGMLTVEVTREFGESTVAKILDLVENANSKKAKAENFITKFARWYTPAVVIGAALLALVPPLILGGGFSGWIHRSLIFLVISCPCALVISIPLSFFGGIGGASKYGVLVKGSNYLEALARTDIVVFDKTGTLTKGTFRVTERHPSGVSEQELLELAALAESYSTHPISLSLQSAYGGRKEEARVSDVEELAGYGVKALVDGRKVCVGNARLMQKIGVDCTPADTLGTAVHVAADGVYIGYLVISDEIKEDSDAAIAALKEAGVRRTVMLTGDSQAVGEQVAKQLGLDEVHAGLLPADKVERLEKLLSQKIPGGQLVFVGDGINDAPVLSRADIGIAMGGLGSDAAIEAADVVIMDDKPSKIAAAIQISRKTLAIVKQNIVFALGVKALVLALGAFGAANMWEAVFADVGVSVIAILNASRALKIRNR